MMEQIGNVYSQISQDEFMSRMGITNPSAQPAEFAHLQATIHRRGWLLNPETNSIIIVKGKLNITIELHW